MAKKYKDAEIKPLLFGKNAPANKAIIGSLALQGINGVSIIVICFSCSSSIVLQVIIAGTEQPDPTINGIKDLPLRPIFLKILSNINEILDI